MSRPRWLVLNQSQSPAFQRLLDELAQRVGACEVVTGMPHPEASARLLLRVGPAYDRSSTLTRAASWLAFLAVALVRVLRAPAETVLLAVTNPPFLMHLVWMAAKLRGHRYALVVWDLYPEHVVQMRCISAWNPVVWTWTALNRMAFRSASVVITIGDGMREAVLRQLGPDAARSNVVVIPNWANTELIRPRAKEDNPFAAEHGQVGKLTVMYSGNLGATHGTETLAQVAAVLRDDRRISFLIVGDGLGRATLEKQIVNAAIDNVRLLPRQEWDVLPLSLATADLAVVSQAKGTEHLSVPSKAYSCLAAGSALIALTTPQSDLGRLVRAWDVGVVCPVDDPDAIASAIRLLSADPERLAALKANARRAAEQAFSTSAAVRRFSEVLAPVFDPAAALSRIEQ